MSYFAVCTFDLKGGSSEDYTNAYSDLAKLGLNKQIRASSGKDVPLPTTMTAGSFNGSSAESVRESLTVQVKKAFEDRRFKSEIFLAVAGSEWSWSSRTT